MIQSAWHTHQSVCFLLSAVAQGILSATTEQTVCLLLLALTASSLLYKHLPSYLSFQLSVIFPSIMLTHRSQTLSPIRSRSPSPIPFVVARVQSHHAGHAGRSHRPSDLPRLWGSPLSHSHRSPNTLLNHCSSSDSP